MAESLSNDSPPIKSIKIACDDGGKSTCNKYHIKGYPVFKIFKNGEMSSNYTGKRNSVDLLKHVREQAEEIEIE